MLHNGKSTEGVFWGWYLLLISFLTKILKIKISNQQINFKGILEIISAPLPPIFISHRIQVHLGTYSFALVLFLLNLLSKREYIGLLNILI